MPGCRDSLVHDENGAVGDAYYLLREAARGKLGGSAPEAPERDTLVGG